jgi:hypothetical protein
MHYKLSNMEPIDLQWLNDQNLEHCGMIAGCYEIKSKEIFDLNLPPPYLVVRGPDIRPGPDV